MILKVDRFALPLSKSPFFYKILLRVHAEIRDELQNDIGSSPFNSLNLVAFPCTQASILIETIKV